MNEMDKKIQDLNKTMNMITYLGNIAVHKAQEENRKKGIPNVYSINGTIIWQKPDGSITTENPF